MIKSVFNITLIIFVFYLIIMIYFYLNQVNLIYFPDKKISFYPDQINLNYKDIYMITKDNIKINSWYIPGEKDSNLVIFCHGNAGNISGRVETIRLIHELNLSLLIFDYRGFGKSEGNISEKGLYLDIEAVYQYATKNLNIDKKKVIIWGRSLGAAVAIDFASKHNINKLIIESAFTSISDMGQRIYPFLPLKFICTHKFLSINKIDKIKASKLFIHSKEDDLVPFSFGKILYKKAILQKSFLEIHGNHANGFFESKEDYIKGIKYFLKQIQEDNNE